MNPLSADDSHFTLPALAYLRTPPGIALLDFTQSLPDTPSNISRLRKIHPADAVHIALTLARLRPKAAKKFPLIPTLFAPQEALEQATSSAVATHKASRFAQYFAASSASPLILDACSSIGGDSLSLAAIAPVLAVDLSAIRLYCLAANAQQLPLTHPIHPLRADITAPPLDLSRIAAFHIDPARRSAGQRHHAYADMLPGPEAIARLIAAIPAGALKLSPAVDFATLPEGHLELIEENSAVVQAVLYTGHLATLFPASTRTATSIKNGVTLYSFTSTVEPLAPLAPPQNFIAELSPALHRAGLAPALARHLAAAPLNADGGLITASTPISHPAATLFRHLTTIPFDEKRLRALLPTLSPAAPGPVEVKSRGHLDLDTDRLQRTLSTLTPHAFTILLYKAQENLRASIATRLSHPPSP